MYFIGSKPVSRTWSRAVIKVESRKPLYHSYMQTVLQSLSPRRQPQERSHRGTPRAPGGNDAERGPALLVQLAQLQLLPPQGAPGWSTAKKWAAVEAASSSTRGSGWVLIGPAGSPVRRRRSRSGALPGEDLDNTGAPQSDAWMDRRSEIGGTWRRLARADEAVAGRSVGRPLPGSAELPRAARRALRRL